MTSWLSQSLEGNWTFASDRIGYMNIHDSTSLVTSDMTKVEQLLRTKKLKVKCYHFFLSELHGGLHGKIIKDMGGYPEEYVPEHQSGTIPRCFMYVYIIYQHLPQIYK